MVDPSCDSDTNTHTYFKRGIDPRTVVLKVKTTGTSVPYGVLKVEFFGVELCKSDLVLFIQIQ